MTQTKTPRRRRRRTQTMPVVVLPPAAVFAEAVEFGEANSNTLRIAQAKQLTPIAPGFRFLPAPTLWRGHSRQDLALDRAIETNRHNLAGHGKLAAWLKLPGSSSACHRDIIGRHCHISSRWRNSGGLQPMMFVK